MADMTPEELTAALGRLFWSNTALAEQLGCRESTVRQMIAGRRTIPAPVAAWLRRLEAFHARTPPPDGAEWRTNPELEAAPRDRKSRSRRGRKASES